MFSALDARTLTHLRKRDDDKEGRGARGNGLRRRRGERKEGRKGPSGEEACSKFDAASFRKRRLLPRTIRREVVAMVVLRVVVATLLLLLLRLLEAPGGVWCAGGYGRRSVVWLVVVRLRVRCCGRRLLLLLLLLWTITVELQWCRMQGVFSKLKTIINNKN